VKEKMFLILVLVDFVSVVLDVFEAAYTLI
jgi:hypothetical protein